MDSGAAPVQAARATLLLGRREAGGELADWRWRMPESKPARPPQRLLSCALAGSMEPEGVESDSGLEGGGHAAGNIGSVAAQVCEIIGRAYVLVTRATERGCQRQAKSLQAGGLFGPYFWAEMYFEIDFLVEKRHIYI